MDIDYLTKYLKYKQKYLKIKNQFGKGAKCIHDRENAKGVSYTHLRELPDDTSVKLSERLNHDDPIEVLEENNGYGRIIKNGVTGWCNMTYLKFINAAGIKVQCKLHPFKGTAATGAVAVAGPVGTGAVAFAGPAATGAVATGGPSSYGCPHDVCKTNLNIKGVAAVIIVKDAGKRSVLLGEERYGIYQGKLNLIGGKMDKPGECPLVATYRETSEESKILPIVSKITKTNWAQFDAIFKSTHQFYTIRKDDTLIFFGVINENPISLVSRLNIEITKANKYSKLRDEREMERVAVVDPNDLQGDISTYAESVIRKNLALINSL
jgi:8-oxo-dGTP pyrophosphatase MutT (NUDIX family)